METTNTLPTPPRTGPNRRRRIASVAGAGLMAGLIAVGAGGVAMAQGDAPTVPTTTTTESAEAANADSDGTGDITTEPGEDFVVSVEVDSADGNVEFADIELSPEDEALFDRFDACLADNGVNDATEDEWEARWENATDAERDALDAEVTAIFEQCESILDDLSEGVAVFEGDIEIGELDDDYELSPEDEAVFDRFDACLEENGLIAEKEDEFDSMTDEALEAIAPEIDAIFETCEPILDDLSDTFSDDVWEIEGCGDEFEDDDDDDEDDDGSEETPGS